jgi:hypothetical protein
VEQPVVDDDQPDDRADARGLHLGREVVESGQRVFRNGVAPGSGWTSL